MSRRSLAVWVAICILTICLQPLFANAQEPPSSAELLLFRVESALKTKEIEALLGLFNWQDVSKEMRASTSKRMAEMLKDDVINISLSSIPTDMKDNYEGYTRDGVLYRPNVSIVGVIDVRFKQKGYRLQMPYGKKDKSFYIASVVEERIYVPQSKEKFLQIMVGGSNTVLYKGYCKYMKDGKELKEEFDRKGNRTQGFWGDRITYCRAQKISPDEEIWLVISEDSQNVFESKPEKTSNPIEYKAKF